jgi:transposase
MNVKTPLQVELDTIRAALHKIELILAAPDPSVNQGDVYKPTGREARIVELATMGCSRADIARELGVSLARIGQIVADLKSKGVHVPAPRVNPMRSLAIKSAQERVEKLKQEVSILEVWDDLANPSEELLDSRAQLAHAQDTLARIMDNYR